eukprot:TRINITY_DN24932_c0_g1_i3.p1 TRINITY_DN24932_c0_g1~~TRINITY_DN24932_c0_g1_i3.p1  ORF type:complete len:559 (+),score=152.90 TRINITY_DN24932_c0_g1_i3:90-1766(+)
MEQGTYTEHQHNDDLEFTSRRSPVVARNGMVACSQPLAAEAGLSLLKKGGNAVDAAIAIAAALAVTEPCSTGLGGDCFLLYYDAKTKEVSAMNGSGRTPAALSLERAQKDCPGCGDELPMLHAHTVTVPGSAAGWADAVAKWGRLPLAEALAPATKLADEGFPVSPITAHHWQQGERQLRSGPHCAELMVAAAKPGERPHTPRAGEIFRNPGMASSLKELAEGGKAAFYQGRAGKAIVELLSSLGGVMTLEDLAKHETTFPKPISAKYHGVDVYEHPPNGQGIAALLALRMLDEMGAEKLQHNGTEYLHLLIEVMRLAFADARGFVADQDVVKVPVQELLSDAYTEKRRKSFDPVRAAADVKQGSPIASCDTVSFQVVDGDGNAVSMVNSNYMGFGTGLIPKGCGFTLQNRGHNFVLDEKHPNCLAPRKRPYHTIIPCMAVKDGELYCSMTNMGGFMQPQGHVQLMLNMIDFAMEPQRAVDKPRFCIGSHTFGDAISMEDGISEEVLKALKSKGHKVARKTGHERAVFGRAQIIRRDPATGVLWAGSDGRADGLAIGF